MSMQVLSVDAVYPERMHQVCIVAYQLRSQVLTSLGQWVFDDV